MQPQANRARLLVGPGDHVDRPLGFDVRLVERDQGLERRKYAVDAVRTGRRRAGLSMWLPASTGATSRRPGRRTKRFAAGSTETP